PGRAFLLCWSMHLPEGGFQGEFVFGPYFLAPFGLALAALLLEMGLECKRQGVLVCALALPIGMVILAGIGHRSEATYQEFLQIFTDQLGGAPVYVTGCAAAAFYGYAALRGVRWASGALTAALAGLAFVSPANPRLDHFSAPEPALLLAAVLLQLALGIWRRQARHCLAGCLLALVAVPFGGEVTLDRGVIAYHLAVI